MRSRLLLILLLPTILTACISVSLETEVPTEARFVTLTLPPTRAVTPRPSETRMPPTPTPTGEAACREGAVLLEDVTIPDNTVVRAGEVFTKTWRFKNTGTCPWSGYTIHYDSGERMNAPDSAPVPVTAAGESVDISLDLTAPAADGTYTTHFSLQNAAGETVLIGTDRTFYVKIIVGAGGDPASTQSSSSPSSPGTASFSVGSITIFCRNSYSENGGVVQELASLINQARTQAGLSVLTINSRLTQAAQGHSIDMACNNFLGHQGSDGSIIGTLVREMGFGGFQEILAIGTPQDAMDQWREDAPHWEVLLNPLTTMMGIGYAYSASSDYGGYFTVDFSG